MNPLMANYPEYPYKYSSHSQTLPVWVEKAALAQNQMNIPFLF